MQWWNDFVAWFNSDDGWRVVSTAIIPFVAIVLAGVIGAALGRGGTRRLLAHQDRELQAAAVGAMIDAGRTATQWSSLASGAQAHADSQFIAGDIRLRLLPIVGATAAADWATHELKAMRRDSANFSFQADQTFTDYRDRLLEWQRRPARARKLFALDLERFTFEDSSADNELVEQQRRWATEQAAAEQAAAASASTLDFSAETLAGAAAPEFERATPTVFAMPAPVNATEHLTESEEPVEQSYDSSSFPQSEIESAPDEPANDSSADAEADLPEEDAVVATVDEVPEPHSESEDNPDDELAGVEIAEPVEHEEWEGQPTQAMPLIEPTTPYSPSTPTYSSTPRDEYRD